MSLLYGWMKLVFSRKKLLVQNKEGKNDREQKDWEAETYVITSNSTKRKLKGRWAHSLKLVVT